MVKPNPAGTKYGPTLELTGQADALAASIVEGGNKSLHWRGYFMWKNPLDLMIYQEIVQRVKPTLVIETGAHAGGSALFWLDMMRLVSPGSTCQVVSMDVQRRDWPIDQDLIIMQASSLSSQALARAQKATEMHERVLVNLDSLHTYDHVLTELGRYSPLVSFGSYCIVEDGVDDYRHGFHGPAAACRDFLSTSEHFEADRECERLGLTNNPGGYLLRVA